jgi:hypothetical protein
MSFLPSADNEGILVALGLEALTVVKRARNPPRTRVMEFDFGHDEVGRSAYPSPTTRYGNCSGAMP